ILKELMLSQDFLEKKVVPNLKTKATWVDLRDQLDMKAMTGGGNGALLVQIIADDVDPKQAQLIAQTVADGLSQYIPEVMTREYEANRQYIEKLVGEAKGQLDDAQSNILDWQEKHHVLTATDAYQDQLKSMARLSEERALLQQRYAAAQVHCDMLKNYKPGDTPPFIVNQGGIDGKNSNVAQLQQSLAVERLKLQQLQTTFKPDTPALNDEKQTVARMQNELNQVFASQVASMRADLETELKEDRSQLASLDLSLRRMSDNVSFGRENLDFAQRQRAIDLWDKNYQDLVGSLYHARMLEQSASRRGAITLLEAPAPGSKVSGVVPKTFQRRLTIAIAVSLVLGVVAALVMEYLSKGMRVTASVEEIMEVRVLGAIPKLPKEVVAEWRENKQSLTRGNGRYSVASSRREGS
ncbi:MAG TPA: hypothetical protein VGO93_20025, partial [Candidatus Xenobia bacterium]